MERINERFAIDGSGLFDLHAGEQVGIVWQSPDAFTIGKTWHSVSLGDGRSKAFDKRSRMLGWIKSVCRVNGKRMTSV